MKKNENKIRADQLLVEQKLAETRNKAQSLIMAGLVFCGQERIEKSSQMIAKECVLVLKAKSHPFVSRGGLKLLGALEHFKVSVRDFVCADIGASTGGFTDCLLKRGAKKVYAIDVGFGQLDWKLRKDPRVFVMEKINFRYFDCQQIHDPIDLAVIDVSFISLKKIIPKAVELLQNKSRREGLLIALIKPQFEVGKGKVGKKGIIRDEQLQWDCVHNIENFCNEIGLKVNGTLPSPVKGQDGNQEYLIVGSLFSSVTG